MKLLGDIAQIRSGHAFRKRPARVQSGGCRLVQMRDLDLDMGIVAANLETVEAPENWQTQRLMSGDILFAARGPRNGAAIFPFDTLDAIAASTLLVLRVKDEDLVNPFYLVWFLNLPRTQEQLRMRQAGSSIAFIPIDDLAHLPVPVPSMEKQDKIFELESLSQEEQTLMYLLQIKRREMIEGIQRTLLKDVK